MLEQVLQHLNNWFALDIHAGSFTVDNGGLELPFLKNGQFFRIVGSVFNDGLHRYPAGDLMEETFDGTIWALAVPCAVINLAAEIQEWEAKNNGANTPYVSESFAGYSYTRAVDSATGTPATWKTVFRSRLNPWRKI